MQCTSRNRLAAAALACGLVLAALPLASALAEAPTPPAPPVAPAAPEGPRAEHRVMIIDTEGGDAQAEDGAVSTRVITRDGKTIIIKTSKAISDEEVERRVAEAEASMPPVPPAPGLAEQRREKRVIIRHGSDEAGDPGEDVELVTRQCDHPMTDVDTSGEQDGKRTRIKVRVCGDGHGNGDMAGALDAVRKARADVAADAGIPADLRAKILGELDTEIARLERSAG